LTQGKLIIFSAPSGSGKTTIVRNMLARFPELAFSVSACTRERRDNEVHGKDYYFLTVEDFINKIENDEFVEWEMVYEGRYYGTLRSEIERIWAEGKHVIFDVDVEGGLNLKEKFGPLALGVFVMVPSVEILEERLRGRGSETAETIMMRLAKAVDELNYALDFDIIIRNEDLETAIKDAESAVRTFLYG
jgi:guanylate kinase